MPKVNSNKILQVKAKIIKNTKAGPDYCKMLLDAPQIVKKAEPGQFVNVLVSRDYAPLLRRPFSIHRVNKYIEILYEVVGQGTEILSKKKPGEKLDILGPLGTGFSLNAHKRAILVAGGMGVAPLIFLAEKLAELKIKNSKCKINVLLGARTKKEIICEKDFKEIGCDIRIATDDGSRGFKGFVSDLLKDTLQSTKDKSNAIIFTCGPNSMLKSISAISKKYKISTQASLEEHMACGIGGCFGCAVNTQNGYKRVCKDGPVFNISDIKF